MRVAFASTVSSLVHILALGGLAAWTMTPRATIRYQVAAGHAISVRFAKAANQEATDQPVSIEPPIDDSPATTKMPEPVEQQTPVERQLAVVEMADLAVQVDAPASEHETNSSRPAKKAETEPTENLRQAEIPRPHRKPTSELPVIEQNAIPLEYEASALAGASVADQWPRLLANPAPVYPQDALLAGIFERQVIVRVRVTVDGRVKSVAIDKSSGWKSMDDSALTTIRRWRFEPAKNRGIPVEFEFRLPVEFGLRRG